MRHELASNSHGYTSVMATAGGIMDDRRQIAEPQVSISEPRYGFPMPGPAWTQRL